MFLFLDSFPVISCSAAQVPWVTRGASLAPVRGPAPPASDPGSSGSIAFVLRGSWVTGGGLCAEALGAGARVRPESGPEAEPRAALRHWVQGGRGAPCWRGARLSRKGRRRRPSEGLTPENRLHLIHRGKSGRCRVSPGARGRGGVPHSPAAHRASPTSGLRQVLEQQGIPLTPSPQEAPGREAVSVPQDARHRQALLAAGALSLPNREPSQAHGSALPGAAQDTHTRQSSCQSSQMHTHARVRAAGQPHPSWLHAALLWSPPGQLSAPWRQTLTRCPEGPVSGRLTPSHPGG